MNGGSPERGELRRTLRGATRHCHQGAVQWLVFMGTGVGQVEGTFLRSPLWHQADVARVTGSHVRDLGGSTVMDAACLSASVGRGVREWWGLRRAL